MDYTRNNNKEGVKTESPKGQRFWRIRNKRLYTTLPRERKGAENYHFLGRSYPLGET